MIRRRFLGQFAAWLVPVGTLAAGLASAVAQQRGSSTPPRERQRPKSERPQQQPLLRRDNVDPKLLAVLQGWEDSSKQIKSLQGEHRRWVYDYVWEVEKRAQGVFYYEDPDKGRIDLAPPKTVPAVNPEKISKKTGKPFKVQKDQAERWVCDGKRILQINDLKKTAEEYPIPPNARGRNIMNGPLPFLFGMPVEQALARYKLTLLRDSDSEAVLRAIPLWKSDAQNYSEAKIILNKKFPLAKGFIGGKKTFLFVPKAVQLTNPAGNLETVYLFTKLEVNKGKGGLRNLFVGNPFAPRLTSYKVTRNDPGKRVPRMVGLHYKTVTQRLTKAGLKEKKDFHFARGVPATDAKQVYVVYKQSPPANSTLKPGKPIVLTLYDKMVTTGRKPAPRSN